MIIKNCNLQDIQIDHTLSTILDSIMEDAYEIHGDRAFRDDPAILCYLGYIDGEKTMFNWSAKR